MSLRMCLPVGVVLLTFTMLKMTFLSSDMRMEIRLKWMDPTIQSEVRPQVSLAPRSTG